MKTFIFIGVSPETITEPARASEYKCEGTAELLNDIQLHAGEIIKQGEATAIAKWAELAQVGSRVSWRLGWIFCIDSTAYHLDISHS